MGLHKDDRPEGLNPKPNRDADKYKSGAYGKNTDKTDPNKWVWRIGLVVLGFILGLIVGSFRIL